MKKDKSGWFRGKTFFIPYLGFFLVNLLVITYSNFMGASLDILGKKIFFLFPSVLLKHEVIPELIQLEYEVYISSNEKKLKAALKNYPGSIVFINIDDGLSEPDWDAWIQGIMRVEELHVSVGIISSGSDEKRQRKYLNILRVQAGFVHVKSDIEKILTQITNILKTLDAKGRRKFIRLAFPRDSLTTINIPYDNRFITGQINDISVVGLSCVFEEDPDLTKGVQIKDIQIKLHGMLLKADGIVFGAREDDEGKIYVILFTARIDPDVKLRIRKFMQNSMQEKMDAELN